MQKPLTVVTTLILAHLCSGQDDPEVGILVDSWNAEDRGRTVYTASTVEVDVMPFLARGVDEGGPFAGYQKALQDLGAEFVRFSPWYPYPLVAVTELYPPDCTATKPATNWNSTLFDGIMRDFMEAVCGEDAVKGKCKFSVAQQLSTMPSWLYVNGTDPATINEDPWRYNGFDDYNKGTELKDETCLPMAQYMARLVGWYTQGGYFDSCGHYHESNLHYNWTVLSVLNENEHNTGQERYTVCFDAIRKEVEKVNSYITLAGPEGTGYTGYVLDPKNHKDGRAPDILSLHAAWYAGGSAASFESFFSGFDSYYDGTVPALDSQRDALAPTSSFVLNEFIPFMNDWCDEDDATALFARHPDLERDITRAQPSVRAGIQAQAPVRTQGCPNWQDPRSNSTRINRKTLGWSAAAALFAYGYGRLALAGYKYVGADQLIGGPWPDNEPAVSCLDWKTGEPNAKYYAVQLLANRLEGAAPKALLPVRINYTYYPPVPAPKVGTKGNGTCGDTNYMDPEACDTEPLGALDANKLGIKDLDGCVAKVSQCKMGAYASFSEKNNDCSWYSGDKCDLDRLISVGAGYVTEVVRSERPIPPPAPLFAMPYVLGSSGKRGLLLVNKAHTSTSIRLLNSTAMLDGQQSFGTVLMATVIEGVGDEPGFGAPAQRPLGAAGEFTLGPFAIAVIEPGTARDE